MNWKTYRNRILWLLYLFLGYSLTLFAQNKKEIKGIVSDASGETLVGVSVLVKNTTIGVMTNIDGKFSVNVAPWDTLVVSYLGYSKQEVVIGNKTEFNIILQESSETLQEVVITAWGTEKKTTLVGSVSTVKPKELKGPTSNLTAVLAGRVAGLISYQTSGEPGRDNADFFVRGVGSFGGEGRSVAPLILINGIESTSSELARIQPDDIEAFSILKDATATSMYGSRGANGVLLINTKRGEEGKTKFNVRYEGSLSGNVKEFNLADNVTYMKLANEAILTRDTKGDAQPVYSQKQIDRTIMGADPVIYPDNNWKDLMIRDYTVNHRANMNISGGAEKAKYYLSLSYKIDNGILKTHELNDFNSNVRNSTIEVRSNIDLKFTPTTDAAFRVSGLFNNYNGPATGSAGEVFSSMLMANPVKFPAVYPQKYIPWSKHPLFGNSPSSPGVLSADYYNPYAAMLSGYSQTGETAITAQFELNQDFKFITPGLKGRLMAYTKRNTSNSSTRSVSPYYYAAALDREKKDIISELTCLNPEGGREWLNYGIGLKEVWSEDWLEMAGVYEKNINVHAVSATMMGYVRQKTLSGATTLERSLPQRNISFSGRATYGYDNRYLGEFNFGYNASERFNSKHRWGFFPSFGIAWNMAEERFMENAKKYIDKIKIRASYGIVGNDNLTDWINYNGDRYFFLNQMSISQSNSIYFGTENTKGYKQVNVTRYGNNDITWELSYKSNLAVELGLFNSLNIEFDVYHDKRTNILMTRTDLPKTMGLMADVRANIGEMESQGFETTVDYNKNINKDLWISIRGTLTYSTNKTTKYEEPEYPENMKYLSHIGDNWNVPRGLIAERLFTDEYEVENSPEQFGNYMAGDIKYRDVNGDGKITEEDYVPLGYPTVPEVVYGFGFSTGYKDFDLSAFFSGQSRVSMTVGAAYITPFVPKSSNMGGQETGLLKVIADDHWSEDNRNPYAFFPRLSTYTVENNTRPSSWWIRDGSFIRLKTVELGYEPKGKWVKRHGLTGFRIYVNGMNLLTFSKFNLWDVEMKGNGLGYPLQRVFNVGVQLSF
ncbi:MAG: TonB-dependent receptor [Dysgonamonadaceae bacterium]|nr:TonB-dependent receptor [Dysgonamonadaceae bacterium]